MHKPVIIRLVKYVGRYRLLLTATVVFALAGNGAMLYAPRKIVQAIDTAATGISELPAQLVFIGGLYLLGLLFTWLAAVTANETAVRVVRDMRRELFDKLNNLPVGYFDTHARGELQSRLTADIDAVADGLSHGGVQLVSGVITVVLSLCFMLAMNGWVTLVVLVITPLCFLVGFFLTRYGSGRFREQSAAQGVLSGYAEEIISGRETVAAFGYGKHAMEKFGEMNATLYKAGWRAQFASALVNPSTRFVNNIAYVLVGAAGTVAAMHGVLTPGGIAGFLTYTAQFSKPFNEITSVTMQIQLAIASARRVFAVLDEPDQSPDGTAELAPVTSGNIQFHDVAFSYVESVPLIRRFRLEVKAGQTVAIVGKTGAGKTTLVNLLMRFYNSDSGQILIDGQDITDVPRNDVRRRFGMVLQETWLFAGTVRENIAYGAPDASDEQVVDAARAAHAHGFIKRMAGGYDALIAEDGGNLSQGQKQLLTIARAMLTNPPMLILDEATSSVDVVTERRIQRAFRKMMTGRTSFIVAHRLSTIRDADCILVLDNGNIVEQGNHEELLAKNGSYAVLYHSQFDKR